MVYINRTFVFQKDIQNQHSSWNFIFRKKLERVRCTHNAYIVLEKFWKTC